MCLEGVHVGKVLVHEAMVRYVCVCGVGGCVGGWVCMNGRYSCMMLWCVWIGARWVMYVCLCALGI